MSQKASKKQANGKKYLDYEAMNKEELIRMLKRVHARIKRVEGEIEELRQILLYGSVQSSSGSSPRTGYTRGRAGYTRGGSYGYGKKRAGKKPAQVEEEPEEEVEEEEEPVEEGPKPSEEKPAEKPARKEGGGS